MELDNDRATSSGVRFSFRLYFVWLIFELRFTILAAIHLILLIGEHKDLLQFLFDGSNATRVFAGDHIVHFFRQMQCFFFYDLVIFDDVDRDTVIDES